jgi:hypothetical protein
VKCLFLPPLGGFREYVKRFSNKSQQKNGQKRAFVFGHPRGGDALQRVLHVITIWF